MEEIGGGGSSSVSDTERANNRPELKPEEEEDRISDLPDVIIQHILSFLPSTKEAIQAGILSKRWRNQWTCVPVLIFSSSGDCFNDYFSQCIEKTLALHDWPKLKKFHIKHVNSEWQLNLQRKVNFAARKYVQELILDCHSYDDDDEYRLPKSLINNAFLVKLELTNCFVNYKWRGINWPCLKSLKLNSFSLPFSSIQNAVSGSPLLESLELTNCSSVYGHAIVSKSLKKLSFVDVNCDDDSDHIEISCPNLEELSVRAWNYVATNLTRKTIESALSGCPLLRLLEVRHFVCGELDIASHSLRKLVLEENDGTCSIEIFCPNLEELNLYALDIGSLKVVNLPSSIGVAQDGVVSKSVARLSFVDVNCDDNGHVKILWPNLQELSVRTSMLISTLSRQAIEDVLSGCLALRSLELRNFLNDELFIASNSLKKLVLEENFGCCAVEISCPNLEELRLYDLGIISLKVVNLPSSVSAAVNFNFYVRDENAAKEIIEQFQHVKKLSFSSEL